MKHLIKGYGFKYLLVFVLGLGTAMMLTQAFTIETSIENTVQIIKSIFISNDGSDDISEAVVSINYNGHALRVHTGSIDVDTICDHEGNNCSLVSSLQPDNNYDTLTQNYLPYYNGSGFSDSVINQSDLGTIGIGRSAHFVTTFSVSGASSFENGEVNIADNLSIQGDIIANGDLSISKIDASKEIVSNSFLQFVGTTNTPCTGAADRGKVEYKQSCDDTDGNGYSGIMQNAFAICAQTGEVNFDWIAIWDTTREIATDCPQGISTEHISQATLGSTSAD